MRHEIIAYVGRPTEGWEIEPASPRRDWMDAFPDRIPYRCLPMVIANQAGWVLKCPVTFSATWDGGQGADALRISVNKEDEKRVHGVMSNFGGGILTFSVPYVFRTSPGYGLHVRGPANLPKDNAAPLEGIVETDWAPYTFTMNWKIMRRNSPVWFKKGEPVCMVSPFPLDMLESFDARTRPISADPALEEAHLRFATARRASMMKSYEDGSKPFQKDYFKGKRPDGTVVEEHRTNFKLSKFEPGR